MNPPAALANQLRWLRFDGELERSFRRYRLRADLPRLRQAIAIAALLLLGYGLVERLCFPLAADSILLRNVWCWPVLALGGLASLRPSAHHRMALIVTVGLLVFELACVAAIAHSWVAAAAVGSLSQGQVLPYESLLVMVLFGYFVGCIGLRQTLVVNAVVLAAFMVVELRWQPAVDQRVNHIFFMIAANLIAAASSYFAEQASRATFLATNQLRELAEQDGLTGLNNRRSLGAHLQRLTRLAARERVTLGVIMVDVDHFKKYNDHYGHAAGDEVLRQVAAVLRGHARAPLDMAARYGGEEFVLLCYAPTAVEAVELRDRAEALCADVAALALPHAASPVGIVTVSVGLCRRVPRVGARGDTADTMLAHADAALYAAKHGGRGRVVESPED